MRAALLRVCAPLRVAVYYHAECLAHEVGLLSFRTQSAVISLALHPEAVLLFATLPSVTEDGE